MTSHISVKSTGGEDTLRLIASSWGVSNVDDKGISEVQLALHKAVEKSDVNKNTTGRGHTEFLSETKVNELVILRANIQIALDKGIVEYVPDTLQWKFASSGHVLMTIAPKDIAFKEIALYNHIRMRQEVKNMLLAELSDLARVNPETLPEEPVVESGYKKSSESTIPPDTPDDDLGLSVTATMPPGKPNPQEVKFGFDVDKVRRIDLDGLNRRDLEKVCKKHVINSFGKKTADLIDKLKKIYIE